MNRITLSMKRCSCILIALALGQNVLALDLPIKDAQLSLANKDLNDSKYEYSLKFKLYGIEEYKKWQKVKDIDRRFKSINKQYLNSETDLNTIRNYVLALDVKQKQKQYAEYNKWMSRFRDTLTATYENSNSDISDVFKIISEDEQKQLLGLELNEQKNELIPVLNQMKINWEQVPDDITLNTKNIHELIESTNPDDLPSQSAKSFELYSKMAIAEYEFNKVEDSAVFDGFEVIYEKDMDKEDKAGAFGLKAVFNLNFLRQEKTLPYSERYNLQRKILIGKADINNRMNELKNIKATLKDDIALVQSMQKTTLKENKNLFNKKNIYSVIDLQTIQSLQKNRFEKNNKLISLKTSILEKVLTLMYESEKPLTLTELRKYVK